jgi:hypothetical protein
MGESVVSGLPGEFFDLTWWCCVGFSLLSWALDLSLEAGGSSPAGNGGADGV